MPRPDPANLRFQTRRGYQWARRLVLTGSVALTVLVPLWFLAAHERSGAAVADRWSAVAQTLPAPTSSPGLGAPYSARWFGLEFLDPLAAAGLLSARQLVPLAMVGVLPVLLLMVFFGRFFCGWLCPYLPLLAVSGRLRSLLTTAGVPLLDLQLPRRTAYLALVAVLVASAVGGAQLAALIHPPSVIAREVYRAVFQGTFGMGAVFIGAIFLFDTLLSRGGFCRSLCPGGALYRLLSARSVVRVERNPKACIDCELCDVVCHLGQQPMTDLVDSGCERCGRCVSVCPTDALRMSLFAKSKTQGAPP